jgi:O-glycosyl hydrolase
MKTNLNMIGGGINPSEYSNYAQYLFDAVSGFTTALNGHKPYSVTIQNEPQNPDPTYPTCTMSVDDMGQIGNALRSLLNNNGFGGVYTIGYEHNWVSIRRI